MCMTVLPTYIYVHQVHARNHTDPLQEQQVVLIAKPSLQLLIYNFHGIYTYL